MAKRYIFAALLTFWATFSAIAQVIPKPDNSTHQKTIPPDNCLVKAKVVKVFSVRNKLSKRYCEGTPCIVRIKIIEVKGYGSSFPVMFSKKQKIEVQFAYSLNSGERGNMHLSGLKKRDYFEAKVKAISKRGSDVSIYRITDYIKTD